jgi:CBS domain-containing protein
MKVSDAMTKDVALADPNQTICDAARMMAQRDTGALPVGENNRLIGVITDRDARWRSTCRRTRPSAK